MQPVDYIALARDENLQRFLEGETAGIQAELLSLSPLEEPQKVATVVLRLKLLDDLKQHIGLGARQAEKRNQKDKK